MDLSSGWSSQTSVRTVASQESLQPIGTDTRNIKGRPSFHCKICAVSVPKSNPETWRAHLKAKRHERNAALKKFSDLMPDLSDETNSGIRVEVKRPNAGDTLPLVEGCVQIALSLEKSKGELSVILENTAISAATLQGARVLVNYGVMEIELIKEPIYLTPYGRHPLKVAYDFNSLGTYKVPLALEFHRDGLQTEDGRVVKKFHVVQNLVFTVSNHLVRSLKPVAPFQPDEWQFKRGVPPIRRNIARADRLPEDSRCELSSTLPMPIISVPLSMRLLAAKGFKESEQMTDLEQTSLKTLRDNLETPLDRENHRLKMQNMLYLEELQMEVNIRKYDQHFSDLRPQGRYLFELRVPGLAESRPSLLRGDFIYVQSETKSIGNTEFEGVIHQVRMDSVVVSFSQAFRNLRFGQRDTFHVQFSFGRFPLKMQHRAVQLAQELSLDDMLFPQSTPLEPLPVPADLESEFYDKNLAQNPEQRDAVRHILEGVYWPGPYIIFGPPGTGKTVTIVETIKQLLRLRPHGRILACTPSNNAADLLCQRLLKTVPANKIFRLCALSRRINTVPEGMLKCCNLYRGSGGQSDSFFLPSKESFDRYRVVITTLISAGRLVSAQFKHGFFDYVFIDESGQASEPETLVPIAGIVDLVSGSTDNKTRLVLAGDPQQLGPVLNSVLAEQAGLGRSLLERMMTLEPRYQRTGKKNTYDRRFITKLVRNYRSNGHIFAVSSKLFYNDELLACADKDVKDLLVNWDMLPTKGIPIIFHGLLGNDMRESNSPSFFNPMEIGCAYDYVTRLLEHGVRGRSIGIIAPYRKQVQKLRQLFSKEMHKFGDMSIGSVEEFQGAERTVIVVTSVRSNADYLSIDQNFKLGFLKNPKRFNTAVTRAKSLLIVIGNPFILEMDPSWGALLRYCIEKGAYRGVHFEPKLAAAEEEEDQLVGMLRQMDIIGDMETVGSVRVAEHGLAGKEE